MGTRSLTFVYASRKQKNGKMKHTPIINLYRQYDGYPSGHGAELAEFLAPFTIGNGLNSNNPSKYANGMGCLAAQLVAHFKEEAGQFYLEPTDAKDCGQDYEYHVYEKNKELRVAITDRGCNFFGLTTDDKRETLFDGTVADFASFCAGV